MTSNKKRTSFTMENGPTANKDYKSYWKALIDLLEESWIIDDEIFYWILDSWIINEINEVKASIDYFTVKNRLAHFDPEIKSELIEKREQLLEVIENFNSY